MKYTAETLQAAFHYLYPNEVPALKLLALILPDTPVVVNIGAGSGTSGLAFLEARDDLFLYTIDVEAEPSPLGSLVSEREVLTGANLWGVRNEQIHGRSQDIGQDWGGGLVDLVFIDGDHTYEGCRDDILYWLPHVKSGGLMAVHDYYKHTVPETPDGPKPKLLPEVDQAVDELLKSNYEQVLRIDSLVVFRIKESL